MIYLEFYHSSCDLFIRRLKICPLGYHISCQSSLTVTFHRVFCVDEKCISDNNTFSHVIQSSDQKHLYSLVWGGLWPHLTSNRSILFYQIFVFTMTFRCCILYSLIAQTLRALADIILLRQTSTDFLTCVTEMIRLRCREQGIYPILQHVISDFNNCLFFLRIRNCHKI